MDRRWRYRRSGQVSPLSESRWRGDLCLLLFFFFSDLWSRSLAFWLLRCPSGGWLSGGVVSGSCCSRFVSTSYFALDGVIFDFVPIHYDLLIWLSIFMCDVLSVYISIYTRDLNLCKLLNYQVRMFFLVFTFLISKYVQVN